MAEDKNKSSKENPEKENIIFEDEKDKLMLDHTYDGIQELNNPLPRWWLYGFYFCIVFAVAYLLYYHVLGWGPTAKQEYQQEMAYAQTHYKDVQEKTADNSNVNLDEKHYEVLTDAASLQAGDKLFHSVCFACHGAQGQGMVGPNLTDEYWIHGDKISQIMKNITTGFPDKGMPPFGGGKTLNEKQLQDLASYIISLQGSNPPNPKPADLTRAKKQDVKADNEFESEESEHKN